MKLNKLDLTVLNTYKDRPRIWDGMHLIPTVQKLAEQGLIEPVPDAWQANRGAFQITDAGRAALAVDKEDQ